MAHYLSFEITDALYSLNFFHSPFPKIETDDIFPLPQFLSSFVFVPHFNFPPRSHLSQFIFSLWVNKHRNLVHVIVGDL